MVTCSCGFVQFDTVADFNANVEEYHGSLHFEHSIIEKPKRFPAVYQFQSAPTPHCCGNWILCEDSTPMMEAVDKKIKYLLKIWESIADPIDSKQNL